LQPTDYRIIVFDFLDLACACTNLLVLAIPHTFSLHRQPAKTGESYAWRPPMSNGNNRRYGKWQRTRTRDIQVRASPFYCVNNVPFP